mmetsp:Transcript_16724/g.52264  ORF Transcript_16724/g.52264 Transcript_16724/m.52264 type:complete len:300 (+) Transcript_16724:168-1067(+)
MGTQASHTRYPSVSLPVTSGMGMVASEHEVHTTIPQWRQCFCTRSRPNDCEQPLHTFASLMSCSVTRRNGGPGFDRRRARPGGGGGGSTPRLAQSRSTSYRLYMARTTGGKSGLSSGVGRVPPCRAAHARSNCLRCAFSAACSSTGDSSATDAGDSVSGAASSEAPPVTFFLSLDLLRPRRRRRMPPLSSDEEDEDEGDRTPAAGSMSCASTDASSGEPSLASLGDSPVASRTMSCCRSGPDDDPRNLARGRDGDLCERPDRPPLTPLRGAVVEEAALVVVGTAAVVLSVAAAKRRCSS